LGGRKSCEIKHIPQNVRQKTCFEKIQNNLSDSIQSFTGYIKPVSSSPI